jgi:hypothetical protein
MEVINGWNIIQWIRLMIGLLLVIQAITASNILIWIIAILFLFQALTNTGCCDGNRCDFTGKKKN